jgi:hypothetical protein
MLAPASRFSNTADTGMRVLRNTQAPPSRPATLSTAGHFDQSSAATGFDPLTAKSYHTLGGGIASKATRNSANFLRRNTLAVLAVAPHVLNEFYSIRINDQWRVIFQWVDREPHLVRIVDYH